MGLIRALSGSSGGSSIDISDITGQTYDFYTRASQTNPLYTVGISTMNVKSSDSPIYLYADSVATTLIDSVNSTNSNKDIDVSAYNVVFTKCNSSYAAVSVCQLTVVG